MSDADQPEERPALPPEGISLSGLTAGGYDSSLKAGGEAEEPAGGDTPEDRVRAAEVDAGGSPPVELVPADDDRLGLPRNGLVAYRKSGGLRFTSRGFVVFRSGWVVPLEGTAGRPRQVTAAALEALEALLRSSGLSRTHRKARATPDGYSHEITARYGGRTRYAETTDGMIPENLHRLIEILQRLMPGG